MAAALQGETFDVVVVGGGSAGAVLASRLSAEPKRRVCLIEAGRDTPPGDVPGEVLDSYPGAAYFSRKFHWNDLRVAYDSWAQGDPRPAMIRRYEQARIMGGGSSINGMFAVRGLKSDYDAWAEAGAAGWSFDDVLPYLKRLEDDRDFGVDARHGRGGPVGIRRIFRDRWPGFTNAMADTFARRQFAALDDGNGNDGDGFFPFALTNVDDSRVSTAIAYLTDEVRRRTNLTILAGTPIDGLDIEGGRVTGVNFMVAGERRKIAAREVVVSAGVFHSPPILLRAGIGPADHLKDMGIGVVADRPGVGAHLQDHPSLAMALHLVPEARIDPRVRRHIFLGLRYSSGLADCPAGDMFMTVVNRAGWHPLGEQMASVLVNVNRSFSDGGTVRLANPWPRDEPEVTMRFFSDRRDLDRLIDGFRLLAAVLDDPAVARTVDARFPTTYGEKARDLALKSVKTWVQTKIAATLMDASASTRDLAVKRLIRPAVMLEDLMADEVRLEDWVRENAFSGWHGTGTCRMGAPDDPQAVVDLHGRVIGVDGLRVADASIMPSIVSANTNITTIMIGEKIADHMMTQN
jgi:5-(hydroxymethyl)furfural/furfural oxidase